jgi:hypothetical protein
MMPIFVIERYNNPTANCLKLHKPAESKESNLMKSSLVRAAFVLAGLTLSGLAGVRANAQLIITPHLR